MAKFSWSLYHQWRHATPTDTAAGTSGSSDSQKKAAANASDEPTEGVNGSKDGRESEERSSKDNTAANDPEGDEGSKVRRRRGKWVPEELRACPRRVQDDKPYVPPAYYGEDDSLDEEDEGNDSSSSTEIDESASQLRESENHSQIAKDEEEKEADAIISGDNISNCTNESSATVAGKSFENGVTLSNSRTTSKEEKLAEVGEDGSTGVVTVEKSSDGSSSWSQYQQKQLEWALVQYPRFAKDRWDNIAKAVPGKTKVNCTHLSRV